MAENKKPEGLVYKNHPLRRVDNFIYYGSMADKYIVLLQILDTVKEQDMDVAKRVSVQLQLTDPDLKSRDRVVKKSEKDSLYAAMDVGCIWLERALAGKLSAMKRIFSALAVALATLLVIGGDAVVNFGGAAASMTDAAPAVPLTVASVSALPTGTTEPSPETALFSGLLGAAALTAHPGGETAEDALLNNEDAAKAAAAQAAEEEPPQETPEADEAPVSTAVQALGVISGTGVRMRSGAGTGYDILKTLDKGAVIELTAQEGDWYRISFDGKRGYVAAQYVTRYDTASGLNGAGRVTADVLNIRTAAKSGSTSLGTVSQGTVIAVTGIESGGWFAVTYNGISGYVASQYVLICPTSALTGTADKPAENTTTEGSPAEAPAETPATPAASASGSSIVSIAQQYLGVPYVYGGSSASGFDCSGFTMYVFAQVGIKLPHGATSQLSYGTEVSRSDLQPGDLVFFQDYGYTASHVGIYIGGDQFIHASSSYYNGHCVVITSLSETYYNNHYLTARRH